METHQQQQHFLLQKVYRLFPSSLTSCHFRSIPDVIPITTKSNLFENSFKKTQQKLPNKNPKYQKHINKYKCSPISNEKEKKLFRERKRSNKSQSIPNSSSANSGWFSSSDEKNGTFVSFSSNSGDSFRLKTSQRFRKCEEMMKIDETGRCSFSSVPSLQTFQSKISPKKPEKKSKKKNISKKKRSMTKCSSNVFPEYQLGPDQISAQVYYSKTRRVRATKKRRKVMKKNTEMVIEDSYAVEKSSKNPYGDFRASMVEMIVAKQMFGTEDLERLLQCFLALNKVAYHEIILDVFSEICETLFSN